MKRAVIDYANSADCRTYNLSPIQVTPWNWASNWVLAMARPGSRDRILDLGCRDNPYVLQHCEAIGSPTVLLDIVPPPPDTRFPAGVDFQQHDLCRPLPFPDESFDVVLSESTLEHLPVDARLACLEEAARVLRPGGRLAVSIGLPLNVRDDPETVNAMASHPFFRDRFCCAFLPIDMAAIFRVLKIDGMPYNSDGFPGFRGFDEARVWSDPALLFDRLRDYAAVPDIGRLREVSIIEIGLSCVK